MSELSGVIPPATTPFDNDGNIMFRAAQRQIDWFIRLGARGIAVGGSTGEGHTLDAEETRDLVAGAIDASAGRVPIIAGIICDSTREAIRRGKLVAELKPRALQVTPVHYLFRPSDDDMIEHFRVISEETGQNIIIYNVVPWTYLSPGLLLKIMEEVPGVIGVKQSAGDLKLFADLMMDVKPGKFIFSAVDALMYSSYCLGAHGSIAAILAAAPEPSVALWNAVKNSDHAMAHDLHVKLLKTWNAMLPHDNLPAATKYAQHLQGIEAGFPRQPMASVDQNQAKAIEIALKGLDVIS